MHRLKYLIVLFSIMTLELGASDTSMDNLLIQNLKAAPSWSQLNPDDVQQRAELMKVIELASKKNIPAMREFIKNFLGSATSASHPALAVSAWSKIYVLNRCYFDVPEYETRSKIKIFGGWSVPEEQKHMGSIGLLWPLRKSPEGTLFLTGTFKGYTGDDYDALGEFDYFSKTYGRRF